MRKSALVFAAVAILVLVGCTSQHPAAEDPHAHHDLSQLPADAFADGANEADIMFASMMMAHHEQALEMSDIVLAKADLDPDVRALAEAVKAAQGPEIEQMSAWLQAWGDDGQDTEHGNHQMDGMLTPEQLDELRAASGTDASRLFLAQMIEHHEGAVAMAEAQARAGANADAVALARSIITSQQAEIDEMREMLARL